MGLKYAVSTLACLLIACGVGSAALSPKQECSKCGVSMFRDAHTPDPPAYRHSEIKRMIRDAESPQDLERLADYFDYQALKFEQKVREQEQELQRLQALPFHARTFPVQVDNTRELIKRYKAKASESSARADTYRERAKEAAE